MSKSFGNAVTLSVLHAVWRWEANKSYSLDNYFKQQFLAIHTSFVTSPRAPVSRLGSLQSALEKGDLTVNTDAFRCKIFDNADRWYFSIRANGKRTTGRCWKRPGGKALFDNITMKLLIIVRQECHACIWKLPDANTAERSWSRRNKHTMKSVIDNSQKS
eukprot:scaffold39753_cov191-Amphora_coffeaeformis.AAC.2